MEPSSVQPFQPPQQLTFLKHTYTLHSLLGQGAFGLVYLYHSPDATPSRLAVKYDSGTHNTITKESYYLEKMTKLGLRHIPRYYGSQYFKGAPNLIMQYVEYSVQEYIEKMCGKAERLTLGQVCEQMLEALQEMHEARFLHQDVKPDNFRVTEDNRVVVLDFGIINEYKRSGRHKEKGKYGFNGTPMFGSINALEGHTQSRRDDIECLGYAIMTFIDSKAIPWANMETQRDILKSKLDFLKSGKTVPPKFLTIQKYLRISTSLKYQEEPDYGEFRYLVENLEQGQNVYLSFQAEKVLKLIRDRYLDEAIKQELSHQHDSFCTRITDILFDREYKFQVQELCKKLIRNEQILMKQAEDCYEVHLRFYLELIAQESIQQRIEDERRFKIQLLEDSNFFAKEFLNDILKDETTICITNILVDEKKWSLKELNEKCFLIQSQLKSLERTLKQKTRDVQSLKTEQSNLIVSIDELKKQAELQQQIAIEKQKQEIEEQKLLQDYKEKIKLKDVVLKQCEAAIEKLLTYKPSIETLQSRFHDFSLSSKWKKDDVSSLMTSFEKTINPFKQLFYDSACALEFIKICMLEQNQQPKEESKSKEKDYHLPSNKSFPAAESYTNKEYDDNIIESSSLQQNFGRNIPKIIQRDPYTGNSQSAEIEVINTQSSMEESSQQSNGVNIPPKSRSKAHVIFSSFGRNIQKGLLFPVPRFPFQ
ncbi:hypothetical protein FGO68_gene402 [Halteria grandinella]|uniref:Casein kinase I n=1 Tax=Halteria grandinella TaxID=5974 RepID=A0A8J8NFJ6_HALGN|nr:hypothetical protein FGO68_gene402 [Halteria grandinella]